MNRERRKFMLNSICGAAALLLPNGLVNIYKIDGENGHRTRCRMKQLNHGDVFLICPAWNKKIGRYKADGKPYLNNGVWEIAAIEV